MKIATIVSAIIQAEKVPVYFSEEKVFSSITYLKEESDKKRGLYLPNCDSSEAFEYCKSSMPDAFNRINKLISTKCDFDEISFSTFSILHELGHWFQYIEFIEKGYNDQEFIMNYEIDRALLFSQRQNEFKTCKSQEDIVMLNKKYDSLYAELSTEKYANDFAMRFLFECVWMIKQEHLRNE